MTIGTVRVAFFCGHDRLVAGSHDDIHFRIDEFAGEARELPRTSSGKAVFHRDHPCLRNISAPSSGFGNELAELRRRNRDTRLSEAALFCAGAKLGLPRSRAAATSGANKRPIRI